MLLLMVALVGASSLVAQPAGAVSWSHSVAAIVYRHCASCHRPGQPAPFSLLTYEDARRRAATIARVTASRYMPPWLPEPGYGHFAAERRLTAAEITVLARWARAGAPPGDLGAAPPQPVFAGEWELGPPDQVISLPHSYEAPADGPDQYRCFVVPLHFDRDRYVRAFEFRTNGATVLHHALLFVDGRQKSDLPDQYDCFGVPGFLPTASLGGWTPGMSAVKMPPDTAVHVPRGSRLVAQLHFHPTGKPELVDPQIGLYFSSKPPARSVMDVALGSRRIDIAPGDKSYKVRDQFNLPIEVQAVGVIPHAHYICRDMRAWAILPGGRKRWLLWIKDWNFNAQEQYRYSPPFVLPAGTDIQMEFTYDNSTGNARNPNRPPKRVTWGSSSNDEMAGLHLQVIPVRMREMNELGQALWGKVMREVGGGFFRPPNLAGGQD